MKADKNQHDKRSFHAFDNSNSHGFREIPGDINGDKTRNADLLTYASRFQSISLIPNNWIWEVDVNGVYTYCSPGVYEIFGYLPEEILGKEPSDFLSPEDGEKLRTIFQHAIINYEPIVNLELLIRNKEGKALFFSINGCPFFNPNGDLIGYRGINHDITKIKEAEEKLNKEQLKLRTLLESISDLIWLKDPDGIYLACNPSFERFLGASESEIVGKSYYDFAPRELADSFREKDNEAMKGNKSIVNLEWVTYAGDLQRTFIEIFKTPISDLNGKLIGLLGVARDITSHKFTEDALFESQARLAIAMDIGGLANWEYDFATNLFTFDDRFYSIFGTSVKEQGEFMSAEDYTRKFVHPDDIQVVSFEMEKALASDDPDYFAQLEHRIIRTDGEVRHIVVRYKIRKDESGKTIKTYGVNQDITSMKKTEIELRELNASKDKFFSIIAHDLRSPFNVFLGYTELMVEEFDNMSQKDMQLMTVQLKKSATNLFNLLENLLEWSRIERGISGFEPKSLLLMTKVTESLQSVLESANKKEIEISCNIPDDVEVFADENMLKSTIRNLTSNAVKFTPKGGKVTLIAKPVMSNFVEISISDTGIGMKKDIVERLFRIDEHISRPGTENEPSSGLGLILCKDFIDKQGGQIRVESEVGKGSTFSFTLPGKN